MMDVETLRATSPHLRATSLFYDAGNIVETLRATSLQFFDSIIFIIFVDIYKHPIYGKESDDYKDKN
ncbi:MAG: hypothetical protein UH071_04220 [Paludibacteraceae bacterium]|nr:hypothetical protein [Paludibacteraceae bacterium]